VALLKGHKFLKHGRETFAAAGGSIRVWGWGSSGLTRGKTYARKITRSILGRKAALQ